MTEFDDSQLLTHTAAYDPAKARAYYLRTRRLKGRKGARTVLPKGDGRPHAVPVSTKKKSKSRQQELEAKKVALENRLDRLRDVLAEKVKAAKKRAGVEESSKRSPKENSAKNQQDKKDKPLTASAKRKKADKAREDYKKEHGGTSTSQEIQQLQKQIADIRAKISAAIKDAQSNRKSTHQTASKGR